MARTVNGMMTDTGKRRRATTPHLGMSRSPVSGDLIRRSNASMTRTYRKPLNDTQRAYISMAHKPNPRIGIKPIKPRQKFASRKKTI